MNFDDTIMEELNKYFSNANEEALNKINDIEEDVTTMLKYMFMEFDENSDVKGIERFGSEIKEVKVDKETSISAFPSLDSSTRKWLTLNYSHTLIARRNNTTKDYEIFIGNDPETDEPRYVPFNKEYGRFRISTISDLAYNKRYDDVIRKIDSMHSKLGDTYPRTFNGLLSDILKKVLHIRKFNVEVYDYCENWRGDEIIFTIRFRLILNNTSEINKLRSLEIE